MNYRKKAILVVGAFLCLNFGAYAQSISLKMNNVSVKKAMTELQEKSGYSFVYIKGDIDTGRAVSIDADQLDEAVSQILKGQNVSYEIQGKNIIIKKGKDASVEKEKREVSGTVKDVNGQPVIGATVKEAGTTNGTITDLEGNFRLTTSGTEIEVSYIGYKTQQLSLRKGDVMDLSVTMREDSKLLDEIVVVGYGTQKREELTSSVMSVKADDFVQTTTPDAAALIRGKVAGLTIVSPDSNPLSTSQISLRGSTTLKAGTSPLVLIDGIPGSLNSVSPNDIEQIDVLKDGSAAAIYGTRGTNGVILITTKQSKGEMKPTIEINSYVVFGEGGGRLSGCTGLWGKDQLDG